MLSLLERSAEQCCSWCLIASAIHCSVFQVLDERDVGFASYILVLQQQTPPSVCQLLATHGWLRLQCCHGKTRDCSGWSRRLAQALFLLDPSASTSCSVEVVRVLCAISLDERRLLQIFHAPSECHTCVFFVVHQGICQVFTVYANTQLWAFTSLFQVA